MNEIKSMSKELHRQKAEIIQLKAKSEKRRLSLVDMIRINNECNTEITELTIIVGQQEVEIEELNKQIRILNETN